MRRYTFEQRGVLILPAGMPHPGDLGSEVRADHDPLPDDVTLRCSRCKGAFSKHSEEMRADAPTGPYSRPGMTTSLYCRTCIDIMDRQAAAIRAGNVSNGNLPPGVERTAAHVKPQTGVGVRQRFGHKDDGK